MQCIPGTYSYMYLCLNEMHFSFIILDNIQILHKLPAGRCGWAKTSCKAKKEVTKSTFPHNIHSPCPGSESKHSYLVKAIWFNIFLFEWLRRIQPALVAAADNFANMHEFHEYTTNVLHEKRNADRAKWLSVTTRIMVPLMIIYIYIKLWYGPRWRIHSLPDVFFMKS